MLLSIIVVNYKSQPLTAHLIESLLHDSLPLKTEIIVVDNNSQDNSAELLRSDFPEITVVANEHNVGLAAAVNKAISIATGKYYLILNPDMVARPGAVAQLVGFMESHPRVGIGGGRLESSNGRLQYSCYRFYTPMTIVYRRTFLGKTQRGRRVIRRFLMKDFDHTIARDVDWLMGACLIVRKQAHKEVGGMDEQYFMYFEDVDWCRRMWDARWRVVYIPEARFIHFHQRSSEKGLFSFFTNRPTREHIKSAVKYFWKFKGQELPRHEKTPAPS